MIPWYVFAIGSAVFSTLFTLFRKKGMSKEHAMEFEVTRTTFAALFGLLLIPLLTFRYTIASILIIYSLSIIVVAGILLESKSLRHMEVSAVAPLFNLTPGFLAILAFIFLRESLSRPQIGGLVLLIAGSYVLETDRNSFFQSFIKHIRSRYIGYAIAAALIFSITALLDKYVINFHTTPFDFLFLVWFFISLNFIIISTIKYNGIRGIKHCLDIAGYKVVLASLFSFLANAFYVYALSIAYVSLVIPIRRLSTIMTTIIGGELFHEKALLRKSIACVIMIVGAYFIII
ncbi:MAG: EamA family transporter [Nanoarchaeota archaeon]|nr:EamA family transporter [Nanoarchaeota archaeon]